MNGVRIFTSNRLENLAELLAEVLREPLSSPFSGEIVLVQSKGMERWVSMQLARYHGICANIRFPFPNAFVREMFRRVIPDLPDRSPFDPDILSWRVMKCLPSLAGRPAFRGLRRYFGKGTEPLRIFQLSERIADLFDQYLVFRPDMIERWERGHGTHWQAVLWRELVKGNEGRHRAALAKAFHERLRGGGDRTFEGLPERVSVFGISSLPEFHMQVLASLSKTMEVNLFLMNPCREYWGDILSDWEMERRRMRIPKGVVSEADLHLEKGNSLLASLGTVGREFFDLLQDLNGAESTDFVDPGRESLLACIQSDILNLRERGREGEEKTVLSPEDRSLRIHSCHGPMREMEVLRDQLLDLFERDPELSPGDILVMTPDIESYAPYIQAVFDVPKTDPTWIPFSISDRSMRCESGIIETFMSILDLRGGRYEASRVLAILENPAVQGRFGLTEEDLRLLRRWVRDTGIRWGIDEGTRVSQGLPGFRDNTWEAGLERLLLGYALPGGEEKMFHGILPYDLVEGEQAGVLGALVAFSRELFDRVQDLGRPRTPREWSRTLLELLDVFFIEGEGFDSELQAVRRILREFGESSCFEGFEYDEPVDIPLIRWKLGHVFKKQGFGKGFLAGGVTFCAMLPMRSIPFKVICLVGMNGDAYPRQQRPLGFDLMARHPRRGDRSRREDDRYLFLEALLSARKTLYISYVGQDIRDNTPLPPSVLVNELLEYVEQGFEVPGSCIRDHLVIRHRLQAFSPAYFEKGSRLFSYSREHCMAARALLTTPLNPPGFLSGELPEPDSTWKTVELGDLCRFFANPAGYLLEKRLGVRLEYRSVTLEDKEIFELRGLDRYRLEQDLLEKGLKGENLLERLPRVRAAGLLPHGSVGETVFKRTAGAVERFVRWIRPFMGDEPSPPLDVDLVLNGFRITGSIRNIYPRRLLHFRHARLRAKDFLGLWVNHVLLNILAGEDCPKTSMLAGVRTDRKDGIHWVAWEYAPLRKGEAVLTRLLEIYWEGLRRPIPFFPESSFRYGEEMLDKKNDRMKALEAASKKWEGGERQRGEKEDASYRICFRGESPLDVEFERLTREILEPLFSHRRKMEISIAGKEMGI